MRYTQILLTALFTSVLLVSAAEAQTFDTAYELYQQEEYEDALELFKEMENDDARALLFIGKSYLALGEYLNSGHYLDLATELDNETLVNEAYFTKALREFRLKNFTNSLEILHWLKFNRDHTGIQAQASEFYNQITRFLTENQRYDIFWQTGNPGIRYDMVRSAIGRVDYPTLQTMMSELEKLSDIIGDTSEIAALRDRIGPGDSYLHSLQMRYQPPEGMIYHVGVALPSFESDVPEFAISRNLYFGITLAAEEFNYRNPDKKIFLRFRDTHAVADSVPRAMSELIWNERIDAVIGPLFSETAGRMSQFAEEYEVPILTPLANSDDINTGHNYTFQLNPTFEVHGEQMANFAVRELNLDTLAVMIEENSLGQASALAFRREAERLGAHVAYYIEEDFGSYGYDLSEVTEVFTTDPVLVDSLGYVPVDGIYAPFTGQAAATLINLLMTDLEAMGTDVVVMGSEEWKNARYTTAQTRNFPIFYTENLPSESDEESLLYFEEDFLNRFGIQPDEFARIGYDTGNYLFQNLDRSGNPKKLKQALREAPVFSGLARQIFFDGNQINRLVHIAPRTDRARERIRVKSDNNQVEQ